MVLYILFKLDWGALRESAKLDYEAYSVRDLLAFDKDVAWLDIVMKEANFMNSFQRVDDFHRRSS